MKLSGYAISDIGTSGLDITGNVRVAGSATVSGNTITPNIGPSDTQQHALPAVASDIIVLANAAQTLSNKTLTNITLANVANTVLENVSIANSTISNTTISNTTIINPTISGALVVNNSMVSSIITSNTPIPTTSGTSVEFNLIPSWVKRITVMFNGVSTSSTSPILIQLGTSGGVENSGYVGGNHVLGTGAAFVTLSTGFLLTTSTSQTIAATVHSGKYDITLFNANTWILTGMLASNVSFSFITSGSKTLSGTLDRVRITTVAGNQAFDLGSINILYE